MTGAQPEQLRSLARTLVDGGPAHGCLFVVVTDDGPVTVPYVSTRVDGFKTARMLLGAHLRHLQATMDRMGVERDLETVAQQAVEDYREWDVDADEPEGGHA